MPLKFAARNERQMLDSIRAAFLSQRIFIMSEFFRVHFPYLIMLLLSLSRVHAPVYCSKYTYKITCTRPQLPTWNCTVYKCIYAYEHCIYTNAWTLKKSCLAFVYVDGVSVLNTQTHQSNKEQRSIMVIRENEDSTCEQTFLDTHLLLYFLH